ncbi:MAG: cytochrome d ubiquinol oxidase subunit II, partial [Thermodesulfobacteriota bacterium]|nr:cytochrome d ubiquinol oxidase subunit II [Thermodesulfobacteriota bacterium]
LSAFELVPEQATILTHSRSSQVVALFRMLTDRQHPFSVIYPNLIPSTLNPTYSMTIYNSASSTLTLKIMLGVALVFVPLVIAYQVWTYRLFRHKVTEADLAYEEAY